MAVITGLIRMSTTKAITAVSRPPTKSIRPVPIRLRTPFDVAHDARHQHARLVGVVIRDREPANVLLHFAAQLGNQLLRGLGKRLGQSEGGQALEDRGAQHDADQRIEELEVLSCR